MSKAREKRGVLMTATSRKRGSWKDLQEEEVADSDEDEGGESRKASQREWMQLEQEVQNDLRKKDLASGIRHTAAVAYDDVADEVEEDDGPPDAPSSPESAEATESTAAPSKGTVDENGERVVPEGVTTAGDQVKDKKRGGEKRTGAARRKKKNEGGEDAPPTKKKKEDEDPDRWLKMRLEGEEKPKRIDATRIVHYHDFDAKASDAAPLEDGSTVGLEEKPAAMPGSFRAHLRRDLFDGSDDDE